MVRLTFLLPFWVSFIQFFTTTLLAQDSTYYFNKDSTKNWWYIQDDVFSFRCNGGSAFSGTCDPLVVDNVVHNPSESHQLNELHFSAGSSPAQRQNEKAAIFGSGQFEHQVLTVTQYPHSSYQNGEYIKTTDLVMVQFKDPNITMVDVNDFMSRNGLSLDHAPSSSLPSGVYSSSNVDWTNVEVSLFDVAGKQVVPVSVETASQEIIVNLQNLSCGIYVLGIYSPSTGVYSNIKLIK